MPPLQTARVAFNPIGRLKKLISQFVRGSDSKLRLISMLRFPICRLSWNSLNYVCGSPPALLPSGRLIFLIHFSCVHLIITLSILEVHLQFFEGGNVSACMDYVKPAFALVRHDLSRQSASLDIGNSLATIKFVTEFD